jgi:putative tricarboxylic transport membrane protein
LAVHRADVGSAMFWMAVGAGVAYAGYDLGLGSLQDPGAGFILFWVGLGMLALAVAVLVGAARTAGPAERVPAGRRRSKVALVLLGLVVYAYALPRAGFVVTTTVLLVFLFKIVEPQRWSIAIGGALASAVLAYVLFKVWLGAQLPPGPFGLG